MLTTDKTVTTVDYWNGVYAGERNNATVDSSNGVRPKKSLDRFDIVVKHAEGPNIIGVGSGHARIEQRIKLLHPDWFVVASDHAEEAKKVSGYEPYITCSAYHLPLAKTYKWDTVIITQCLEWIEFQDKFLFEAARVGKKLLCTVPLGEMKSWSQLFVYNEKDFCEWLKMYGTIEVVENYTDLLLVKIKFI